MAIAKDYDPRTGQWITTTPVIRDTTDADEWTPHPDWPDIKYILQNDTSGYAGSFIELITDDYDTISLSGGVAYRTSDGAYYTSATVTHTWDKDYDVSCARGYKTRWVITYLSTDTLSVTSTNPTNTLWLIFNCNLNVSIAQNSISLEAIEFLPSKTYIGNISGNLVYYRKYKLYKIPSFSSAVFIIKTDSMFYFCTHILICPKINMSACTTCTTMFYMCVALNKIEEELDMQNIISTTNMFTGCFNLKDVQIKNLKVSLTLTDNILLSHASLLYLLQNLQTVAAGSQTLTLGATNLAKLTNTEKALATDKGWLLA